MEKKKRAQDFYYENHNFNDVHASPLRRDNRRPVKQRLGRTNVTYAGTSTAFLPPKQRLRKVVNTLNNKITQRKMKTNIAQQRLYRIRARNQETCMNNPSKKIKIRRHNDEPKNLQVEVVNNSTVQNRYHNTNNNINRNRRFRMRLNTQIQMEIKTLQLQFTGSNVPPSKIIPAVTLLSMNDRFARLA